MVQGGSGGNIYSWIGLNGYIFLVEDFNDIIEIGDYCVMVIDFFGCIELICFDVYEVLCLEFFFIQDVCVGEENGGVDVMIAGGSCLVMNIYVWIDLVDNLIVGNGLDLNGVVVGVYCLIVIDCVGNSILIDIMVNENDLIVIEGMVVNVMNVNDGSIMFIIVSGGSGVGYIFVWEGFGIFILVMQNIINFG